MPAQRPYLPQAERTLISALNVFGAEAERVITADTEHRHHAPIEMIAFSADGKRVYSIDAYGATSCFDADTRALLWEYTLANRLSGLAVWGEFAQIIYDGAGERREINPPTTGR